MTDNQAKNVDFYEASVILEYIMHEIFASMCISSPGLFNLDKAEFINLPERRSINGSVISHDISMSSHLTENYLYEAGKLAWLPDITVSAIDAYRWLQRASPRFTMLGDNPANRCVFALMHLCKGEAYAGSSVAWLFNGLESLFGCRPGENRAALQRRIGSILGLDQSGIALLKKEIGILYDLRSAFVHGGLPTIHPVRNEGLDARVDGEIMRLMKAMDKGVTILIAVLKSLVQRGIDWPRFEEKLSN